MVRILRPALLPLLALLWATMLCVASSTALTFSQTAVPFNAHARVEASAGAIITVTTTSDEVNNDGDCSLREATQAADTDTAVDGCAPGSGGDTLKVPAGLYLLSSSQITLTGTITLQGSLTGTSILDGQRWNRVLFIAPDARVVLRHLDIRNGRPFLNGLDDLAGFIGQGGGILNYGTTWIAHSTIHDNEAGHRYMDGDITAPADGAPGGGIYNQGVMTITNSTISGNKGGDTYLGVGGGGRWGDEKGGEGGAIANAGTLTLDYATVTDNSPGQFGGGVVIPLDTNLVGGVFNAGGTITIKNSIIAGNLGLDCAGSILDMYGFTLVGNTSGCSLRGDFIHWPAYLGPLQDNGGPTLTHALDKKSPAIDAGSCTDSSGSPVMVDQRGETRPQGDGCDIGAYESPYTATVTITPIYLPKIDYHPFPCIDIARACNLTNYSDDDRGPRWSPDGSKIVYTSNVTGNWEIYLLGIGEE